MNKKKKFLICIASVITCVLLLACVILASVDESFTKGENYDVTHEENGCCTLDSGTEPHYVTGYKDGLADQQDTIDSQQSIIDTQQSTIDSLKEELKNDNPGDDTENPDDNTGDNEQNPDDSTGDGEPSDSDWKQKYYALLSQYNDKCQETEGYKLIAAEHIALVQEANRRLESLGGEPVPDPVYDYEFDYEVTHETIVDDAFKQNAVNEYLSSDEYVASQEQVIFIAINDFKQSDEYKQAGATQFELGRESGYQAAYGEAYDAVYSIGLAEGYAQFMATEQFESIINTQCKNAMNDGYKKGFEDGKTNSVEFDATALVSLIAGIVILLIAMAVILPKLKKIKKRR